nr:unnamed protein product [Spirometra erinaceieuropaei]
MEFLEQGHLLSDLQHGFRQNRSCLSSLLFSKEQWTRALDEEGRVDIIYTDFKKAFGSVPHKRLIYKLSEIGIRGGLLTWITDFLGGGSQTVCIEASRSTPTPVLSGVPQGSVLGPLLFLVYINDCVDDLGCSAIMFADDVKLWRPIRSDADRYALQDSLNRLNSWSARWLLNFNVHKCVVLRLRTRRTSKEDDPFQYVLGGQPLSNIVEQKDLGVLMTSLKPSSQCQRAAKIAIRVLFALRRGFVQIDKQLFEKAYWAFVRSHLKYAVQAWRPWLKKDYKRLERVQVMATKMVKNLHHLLYETRLTELNLLPLNYRQLRGDLIQTYRIATGLECALNFDEVFELAETDRLRGHPFKLQRKLAHSDVRRNAFSHRITASCTTSSHISVCASSTHTNTTHQHTIDTSHLSDECTPRLLHVAPMLGGEEKSDSRVERPATPSWKPASPITWSQPLTWHAVAMAPRDVMTHPERVRFLYKLILRLHRSLPTEMRLVGDKYVKEEFRKHKTADKQFIGPFMIEWSRYASTLAEQLTSDQSKKNEKSTEQTNIGIPLQETDLEKFSAKQLNQLLELADEFYRSEKSRNS